MPLGSPPLLYEVPIDDMTWAIWGSVHQSDHFQIASGISDATGIIVPVLPIDPVPLPHRGAPLALTLTWFMNHQIIHDAMNAALGLGNFDLSYVDFSNPEQITVWIQYNAYAHQAVIAAISTYQPPAPAPGQPSVGILPQPAPGTQVQPQQQGVLAQGNPGILTIQPQSPGVQPQAALGPQPALQPFATLQPQPALAPANLQPGTPLQPGGGLTP
jgi:hypothetical protein